LKKLIIFQTVNNKEKKMSAHKIITTMVFTLLISGCATTTMHTYQAVGKNNICEETNLGKTVVLPEAAWRHDQKEPRKREIMALEEIEHSFQNMPCGDILTPEGIRKFSNWSSKPEPELLKKFSDEGVDTIIILRIEELTPRLQITFSLPFLWSGSNEVDFRIRVISVKTGTVLNDMRVKRFTGGPFNIRPAEWSRIELKSALSEIIGNSK